MKCVSKLLICDDEGGKFFGKGPVELLIMIDKHKSINKAASEMYMSYHKALSLLKSAEEGFGITLVERQTGGANGGGTTLTAAARELINKYSELEKKITDYSKSAFNEVFSEYQR